MRCRRLARGEVLFHAGDPGAALYVLTAGSVSVAAAAQAGAQRFVSFSPGMIFGETAVLDGRGRTAAAIADAPSEVHELPADALAELQRTDPQIGAQLYRNLAMHLSARLRSSALAWRHADA
jgi:CRP-like cAMP-binding protein